MVRGTGMDRFYRFLGGLLPERRTPIHRAVARDLRRRGIRLPRGMRIFLDDARGQRGYVIAPWGSETAFAWKDEALRIVDPGFIDKVLSVMADGRLMEARESVLDEIRAERDRAPSWTHLAHPMAIRLLRMGNCDPGEEGFFHRGGVSIPNVDFGDDVASAGDVQDHNAATTTSGRHVVKRIKVSLGDERSISMLWLPITGEDDLYETIVIVHGHSIPMDVAISLPGRRLMDVLDLTDGDARLDAALRTLTIRTATGNEHGSSFTLEPTRWITCAEAPEEHRGWDAATPWIE